MNRVFTSRHLAAFLILLLALALAPAIALAQSGYVTASALYMREEPLLDAKVVATLHQGDKVEITGKSSNGKWYKVTYGKKSGYVWKSYISLDSSSASTTETLSSLTTYIDSDGGHHGSYPTASSKPSASKLQKGDSGSDVKKLQLALQILGYYSGKLDGSYGDATAKAVSAYQKAAGLTVDGVAGSKTLNRLFSTGATSIKTESLDWFEGNNASVIPKGATFYIKDCKTGEVFACKRWSGGYHLDAEPLTTTDTSIMSKIYGGSWSWDRRAILVYYRGHVYAASMNGMPHGTQTILDNDFEGQFCIHFLNSTTHGSQKVDPDHQGCVKKALGYTW